MAFTIILLALFVAFIILMFITTGASQRTEITFDPQDMSLEALADEELQSYLPDQKIAAIKRYRQLTGSGLAEAKYAVEYLMANPGTLAKAKHDSLTAAANRLADTGGAGVRDLIDEGRIEEAVRVYADFMGVDEYTARDAVEKMQNEL
ncbi:MAG: hypothetical protein KC496_05515 [Anaerolineae bacterium]|nr:hypothetical protein [Anaerolineae bacterium]